MDAFNLAITGSQQMHISAYVQDSAIIASPLHNIIARRQAPCEASDKLKLSRCQNMPYLPIMKTYSYQSTLLVTLRTSTASISSCREEHKFLHRSKGHVMLSTPCTTDGRTNNGKRSRHDGNI